MRRIELRDFRLAAAVLLPALFCACSSGEGKHGSLESGNYLLSQKAEGDKRVSRLPVSLRVRDGKVTMLPPGEGKSISGPQEKGRFRIEAEDDGNTISYEGETSAGGVAAGSWTMGKGGAVVARGTFTLKRRESLDELREEAIAAARAGDYKTAYEKFLPLAEDGDDKAMITIGLMFYQGQGLEQDYGKALDWFVRAYANGNGDAYSNMGVMYRDGLGVKPNKKIAYCLFLMTHVLGLGSESTQYRANNGLRGIIQQLSDAEIRECLNYTVEYIDAYVESKGALEGMPEEYKPSAERLALKDKPWWIGGEMDFLKEGK